MRQEVSMMQDPKYFTIPKLAERLGITPASIRDWIRRGRLEPPPELPATGERAYPAIQADRIERWYWMKVANGKTRGPGSEDRRARARRWLEEHGLLSLNQEGAFTYAEN
jgi:hypothetical protein